MVEIYESGDFMKRTLAVFISLVLTSTLISATFSSCSKKKSNTLTAYGIYDEEITVGEWIRLVDEKFEFTYFDESNNYFTNIPSSNPYYIYVQAAANVGLIPETYDLDLDQKLTRELCAVTLANAYRYPNNDNVFIDDIDQCTYKNEIKTVINSSIMSLDSDKKFNPKENILYIDAAISLENAYKAWANHTIDKNIYNCELKDNVLDYAGIGKLSEDSDNSFYVDEKLVEKNNQILSDANISVDESTDTITADKIDGLGIEEGKIIIIPAGYGNDDQRAFRIDNISQTSDGKYSISCSTPELTEIVENMEVAQVKDIDFNDDTSVHFYDSEGNPIVYDESSNEAESPSSITDVYYNNENYGQIVPLGYVPLKDTTTFKVEGEDGGGSFTVKHSVKVDNKKYDIEFKIKKSGDSLTIKSKVGDYDVFKKPMDSIKYDSQKDPKSWTKEEAEQMKLEEKSESGMYISKSTKISNVRISEEHSISLTDQRARFSLNFDVDKEYEIGGKATWEANLFKMRVDFCPGLAAYVNVNFKMTLDGVITIGAELDNCGFGMSYDNGNISTIRNDFSISPVLEGKIDFTISFPVEIGVCLIDEKVCKIYFNADPGVQAVVTAKLNLVDFPDESEYYVFCEDRGLYPKLTISGGVALGANTRWEKKFEITKTLLDKDHTIGNLYLHKHLESGVDKGEHCIMDDLENAKKAYEKGILAGESLQLSDTEITLNVGDSCDIQLKMIPKQYKFDKDVFVKVSDSSLIETKNCTSIDKIFPYFKTTDSFLLFKEDSSTLSFKAIKPGVISINYMTKDAKYTTSCTVIINSEKKEAYSGASLILEKSYITLNVGDSQKLNVSVIPDGLSENDLIWESSNNDVVTVDNNGTILAINEGSAIITVKTNSGQSYKCSINVNNLNTQVVFIPNESIAFISV